MPNRESLQQLERPTKFLLFGVVLGIIALVTGYTMSHYYSGMTDTLVEECISENNKPTAAGVPRWTQAPLVCNVPKLVSAARVANSGLVGIEAKIVEAHRLSNAWLNRAHMLGGVLIGIFALPYGWYFLLRRIKELSNALLGK